jgi:hypothetical protein
MLQTGIQREEEKYILLAFGISWPTQPNVWVKANALFTLAKGAYCLRGRKKCLTLFLNFTKITIHMAMRINVTTTPTRTPSTGVICTRTARDDAGNSKNIRFVVDLQREMCT